MTARIFRFPFPPNPKAAALAQWVCALEQYKRICRLPFDDPQNEIKFRNAVENVVAAEQRYRSLNQAS